MGKILAINAAAIAFAQMFVLGVPSPAGAISVELAKRCRGMAIAAHPPTIPGTMAYAQAERDFFRQCVAKNGNMQDTGKGNPPAAPSQQP
jgi:hypothetical protein